MNGFCDHIFTWCSYRHVFTIAALAISVATFTELATFGCSKIHNRPFTHHHRHFWKYLLHVVQRLSVYLALIKHLDLKYFATLCPILEHPPSSYGASVPISTSQKHAKCQTQAAWDVTKKTRLSRLLMMLLRLGAPPLSAPPDLFTNIFGRKPVRIIRTRSRRHAVKKCIVSFQSLCLWLLW